MAACLIIGDSIALGLAIALAGLQPGACDVSARIGATTAAITSWVPAAYYRLAIVSAGSNDPANARLILDMRRLRSRLRANNIIWVYPRKEAPAWSVHRVALEHGDQAIGLSQLLSPDGVHPRSYAAAVRIIWRSLVGTTAAGHQRHRRDSSPKEISEGDLAIEQRADDHEGPLRIAIRSANAFDMLMRGRP